MPKDAEFHYLHRIFGKIGLYRILYLQQLLSPVIIEFSLVAIHSYGDPEHPVVTLIKFLFVL